MITELKEVIDFGDKPCIIKFSATWCRPCKMISPHYKRLSETFEKIKFYEVDVDMVSELASKYEIKNLPTFVAVIKGKKSVISGADPKKLQNFVSDFSGTI